MRNDPIVTFRATGTELREQTEQPAQDLPFDRGRTPSVIQLSFDMASEPGDTVEAYRQAAQTMGWTWVTDGCSRVQATTGAVFGKPLAGFNSTLVVEARLRGYDASDSPRGELLVTLRAAPGGVNDLGMATGFHRNDVQCLRGLDPSDPDLQQPNTDMSSEGLCGLISVAEARTVFPDVVPEISDVDLLTECLWVDGSGLPVFVLEQASQPRAYYEDLRLPGSRASDPFFYFSVDDEKDPRDNRQLWVAGPGGPFLVYAVTTLDDSPLGEDPLLAIARLLADSHVPVPTTNAQGSDSGELIDFMLDGGIAGNRRVTVTEDGVAIYDREIAEPVRSEISPGTMEELRAALSEVDFHDLSSSYGSHAGPDDQAEVFTYRGKTVRVWSNGPPELRRLTAILTRLLEEDPSRR
ncbi:MAG: hypothetical protein KY450_07960, partial [Actinobacteria bacterium]|nr:hypothetical protein [Actinomycetota bacterium]